MSGFCLDLSSFRLHFCTLEPLFLHYFFDVFLEGDFCSPFAFFCAKCAQHASHIDDFLSLFEDGWDIENVCFTIVKQ